jgi:outer membrane lipoprotein-sorting protein
MLSLGSAYLALKSATLISPLLLLSSSAGMGGACNLKEAYASIQDMGK